LVTGPSSSYRVFFGCIQIFKVKENVDGSLNKYKAWLVVKGFTQQPEFDFSETVSPVIKPFSIRIILTIALTHKLSLIQLHVNNAVLNCLVQEEFYITQPINSQVFSLQIK